MLSHVESDDINANDDTVGAKKLDFAARFFDFGARFNEVHQKIMIPNPISLIFLKIFTLLLASFDGYRRFKTAKISNFASLPCIISTRYFKCPVAPKHSRIPSNNSTNPHPFEFARMPQNKHLARKYLSLSRWWYNRTIKHLRQEGTKASIYEVRKTVQKGDDIPEWAMDCPQRIRTRAIFDACNAVKNAKVKCNKTR
jgi:hypothetical protein